ncbi:MAG: flagellar hook-associated protein FlgL [bacterium]
MRISDRNIQSTYLNSLARNKADLATIQKQMVTQSKINKPSDSPLGTTRVLRLTGQIESFNTYSKNIESGLAYIDNSSLALEGISKEIQTVLSDLTNANNATVSENLSTYADKIKASLSSIIDLSNTEFDGQFLFGGTDNSTIPISSDSSGFVEFNSDSFGGERKIRLSNYTEQKINMTGRELFAPVLKQSGNLDSSSAIGAAETITSTVYNSEGTAFSLETTYTKNAANQYVMDYQLLDSASAVISTGSSNLSFNAATGALESVDGSSPKDISIIDETNGISFLVDVNSFTEKNSAATLSTSLSQKADIFNVLQSVSEKLAAGELPDETQVKLISDFEKSLTNKISELGSYRNRLTDTDELNQEQSLTLQELVSKEKDVDIAQLAISLQEKQYNLDLTYKISATLLPKSLLDFI